MNDQLTVLPISSKMLHVTPVGTTNKSEVSANELELTELKESLRDTQPVSALLNCCKTLDQVRNIIHQHLHLCICKLLMSVLVFYSGQSSPQIH